MPIFSFSLFFAFAFYLAGFAIFLPEIIEFFAAREPKTAGFEFAADVSHLIATLIISSF